MIIGVDGNEANVEEKVGVSVYTSNLLNYFKKNANKKLEFWIYLRNAPNEDLPDSDEFFSYKIVRPEFLWSQISLPFYFQLNKKPDVFFSPAHYSPRLTSLNKVVTIHDLSYLYYPNEFLKKDLYKLKNWTEYSIKNAKRLIVVSENTLRDLVKFYTVPTNKVSVIYNGYEKKVNQSSDGNNFLQSIGLKKDSFILYVGTLQPRKNIKTLISAFGKLSKNKPEYKLVIVGKKGWLYQEIFQQVKKQNLEEKVIFTGFVSDNQLAHLYKNALCFVLPSFYEGFGIPILEAMSYSCPVIASETSSLPEIGKDACLYFDPRSEKELFEKMQILADNKDMREKLISKGKDRINFFSWEKAGKQTLDVLTSIWK